MPPSPQPHLTKGVCFKKNCQLKMKIPILHQGLLDNLWGNVFFSLHFYILKLYAHTDWNIFSTLFFVVGAIKLLSKVLAWEWFFIYSWNLFYFSSDLVVYLQVSSRKSMGYFKSFVNHQKQRTRLLTANPTAEQRLWTDLTVFSLLFCKAFTWLSLDSS